VAADVAVPPDPLASSSSPPPLMATTAAATTAMTATTPMAASSPRLDFLGSDGGGGIGPEYAEPVEVNGGGAEVDIDGEPIIDGLPVALAAAAPVECDSTDVSEVLGTRGTAPEVVERMPRSAPRAAAAPRSSSAKVAADCGRCEGSFAMARSTARATGSGSPTVRRSGTGSCMARVITGIGLSSVGRRKAAWPDRSANRVEPSEYTSDSSVGRAPWKTSGAACSTVAVMSGVPVWGPPVSEAIPKSVSFGAP
jgi:hypothetical protein